MTGEHKCRSSFRWTGEKVGELDFEEKDSIKVSVPEQFGGDSSCVNPEILLAGAVDSCMGLTLLGHLRRSGADVEGFVVETEGIYGKGTGGLEFKGFKAKAVVKPEPDQDREKLKEIISGWDESCLVTKSLNVPVEFSFRLV